MDSIKYSAGRIIIIMLFATLPLLTGCKGSDTREAVDGTIEELAGKKKVDQMKEMEKDIGKIQEQQSDLMKQMDNMDENQ